MKGIVVDKKAKFTGELESKDNAVILGKIKGSVKVDGIVKVEDSGLVEGDIEGKIIFAFGKVKGNIKAKKSVILKDGCSVKGDIITPSIIVEERSSHNGKITFL